MTTRWKNGVAVALIPVAVLGLAACSKHATDPTPAPPEATSTTATTESSTSTRPVATAITSVQKEASAVRKVADMYGSLAPADFFTKFDDCAPNGIPDSSACSGPEVGQFQFFKSDAKAASTTQLLTELRSSRVVEDSGDRIVGWSTLGTTAVITVVDNKQGLTMQQMVSSDKQDPLQRIYELGLAKRPATATATATVTPTSTTNPA